MLKRDHLHRLSTVWAMHPIYFLTSCTHLRRPSLTSTGVPDILTTSWHASARINGWAIGRYVVMPDHVHFFAQPWSDSKSLSTFMRDWKRWTGGGITRAQAMSPLIWQPEFFDHVLRSVGSYDQKWAYVRENPVRAGLVARAEDWPHAGECECLIL